VRQVLGRLAVAVALVVQFGLPVLHPQHQHQSHPQQDRDRIADHSDPADSHRHDESRCLTCQLFAALRAFAPLNDAPTPLPIDLCEARCSPVHTAAIVPPVFLSEACPRGPPAFC
jgi:hypothetical protein